MTKTPDSAFEVVEYYLNNCLSISQIPHMLSLIIQIARREGVFGGDESLIEFVTAELQRPRYGMLVCDDVTISLDKALVDLGMSLSLAEARRTIVIGAVRVNDKQIKDERFVLAEDSTIRCGKNQYGKVRFPSNRKTS